MDGVAASAESAVSAARGRIDKRQAILDAAFAVFARVGYPQAAVDVIAAEAGVAKATVYAHFHDKETLLVQAISAESSRALAKNLAVVEQLTGRGGELRATLERVGHQLLACYCENRSIALWRLLASEGSQFAELLTIVQVGVKDRVTEALADRLARLAVAGELRLSDPSLAAEQLIALLTGPMETRTRLGTRTVPDSELWTVTRAATETFLRAFGP